MFAGKNESLAEVGHTIYNATFDDQCIENVEYVWLYDFLGRLIPFAIVGWAGLLLPMTLLEWAIRQPWAKAYLITYEGRPRWENEQEDFHSSISSAKLKAQANHKGVTMPIVVGTVLASVRVGGFSGKDALDLSGGWRKVVSDLLIHYIAADLTVYIFHFACHKSDFLWKHVHHHHHREHEPSAHISVYSSIWEALLLGVSPHLVAATLIRPHPLSFYICLWLYLTTAVYAHSGIQLPLLDIFTLGFLPFRNSPRFHDAHHQISVRRDRHLGTNLWVWDWIFGTLEEGASL